MPDADTTELCKHRLHTICTHSLASGLGVQTPGCADVQWPELSLRCIGRQASGQKCPANCIPGLRTWTVLTLGILMSVANTRHKQ